MRIKLLSRSKCIAEFIYTGHNQTLLLRSINVCGILTYCAKHFLSRCSSCNNAVLQWTAQSCALFQMRTQGLCPDCVPEACLEKQHCDVTQCHMMSLPAWMRKQLEIVALIATTVKCPGSRRSSHCLTQWHCLGCCWENACTSVTSPSKWCPGQATHPRSAPAWTQKSALLWSMWLTARIAYFLIPIVQQRRGRRGCGLKEQQRLWGSDNYCCIHV